MTRPRLAAAIALSVLFAAAVVVLALVIGGDQSDQTDQSELGTQGGQGEQAADPDRPLPLPAIPAPAAGSAQCRSLLERLPAALTSPGSKATGGTGLRRRSLAPPEPAGTAAWGPDGNIVTLRCGIDRPAELTRTAPLLEVSGVRWLRVEGEGLSTWVAVDRAVYIGLTFGDSAGTGPLQDLSGMITATLPAQRVQPNP